MKRFREYAETIALASEVIEMAIDNEDIANKEYCLTELKGIADTMTNIINRATENQRLRFKKWGI